MVNIPAGVEWHYWGKCRNCPTPILFGVTPLSSGTSWSAGVCPQCRTLTTGGVPHPISDAEIALIILTMEDP